MEDINIIGERDRASVLHPFTLLKSFANGDLGAPTIVTGGKGIHIQDASGRTFIDGFAGLYCVNVGYGRSEVAEAIAAGPQADVIIAASYAPEAVEKWNKIALEQNPDLAADLPAYPPNFANALHFGVDFWMDHIDELNERYKAWVAAK